MKIICIGLNDQDAASIGRMAGNYDIELLEVNSYNQLPDILRDSGTPDAFIIEERSLSGKGMDLGQLLRLDPATCLAPVFSIFPDHREKKVAYLPMALDRSCSPVLEPDAVEEWFRELLERGSSGDAATESGFLEHTNILEVITSLHESGQTGELILEPARGDAESRIWFGRGEIINAETRGLEGIEAFFELLTWKDGRYRFKAHRQGKIRITKTFRCLLKEALELVARASLFWSLVPHGSAILFKTESESALADKAEKFFREKEYTYDLIDGFRTIDDVLRESPLSRPRALCFLAELVSLGDVELKPEVSRIAYGKGVTPFDRTGVLVVDDSKLVGSALAKIFSSDPRFTTLGQAFNGLEALEMIEKLDPDVVTLDVEMPEMDGLTALKHIMVKFPRPVVMISSLTQEGSSVAFEALRYGAVDIIPKPSQVSVEDFEAQKEKIRSKVFRASRVSVEALHFVRKRKTTPSGDSRSFPANIRRIYAIGTGMGGYNTLLQLIPSLPASAPASYVVMTQIDPRYIGAFVSYLNDNSEIRVEVVEDNQDMEPATCYLCTTGNFLVVRNSGNSCRLQFDEAADPDCQKMSLDRLFLSLAESLGERAGAVILSGTGTDGVKGISSIADAGGSIFVQKPESCLEPELPTRVLKAVSSVRIVPVKDIPRIVEESCR